MDTPAALDDQHLQLRFDLLDIERQRALRTVRKAASIIVPVAVGLLLFIIFAPGVFLPQLLFVIPILALALYTYIHATATKQYRSAFKSLILPEAVKACTPPGSSEIVYKGLIGIPEHEFRLSGLFREPDRYKSEDLITGTLGQTEIRFSEVHAEYRKRNSKGKNTYHDIFHGVFFVADFHKQFLSSTLVMPDNTEPLFGNFGRNLQKLGNQLSGNSRELVQLEDPEFEKLFAVYSNNQVEARYLLTPSLMRRLIEFRNRSGSPFRISFLAGNMILAMPLGLGKGWLEPPPLGTPLCFKTLEPSLEQLKLVFGIVEDLNLNTRIWSK